jgi:hypothetical protein
MQEEEFWRHDFTDRRKVKEAAIEIINIIKKRPQESQDEKNNS